ncbi:TetR/AcrR family transcriptional regulator [Cryptosporangium sp. NPDC051539]|uniref:TetR/AcrR family transcriptional regulator n=1 Tax=Cryptosporangium sp. NPDC051539 TaxID=3363962 RepID=UPI00379D5FCF
MATSTNRTRRRPEEVRSLLLGAARELFTEVEYDRVSTRAIAERAQVTHATLFRHFTSKEDLFVAAVFNPFREFIRDYVRRWTDGGHGRNSSIDDTRVFVEGLYALCHDNRRMLATMIGPISGGPSRNVAGLLEELFAELQAEVTDEVTATGSRTIEVSYAVRFSFALIFGMAVLDDALYADPASRPDQPVLAQELAGYIVRGSSLRD